MLFALALFEQTSTCVGSVHDYLTDSLTHPDMMNVTRALRRWSGFTKMVKR